MAHIKLFMDCLCLSTGRLAAHIHHGEMAPLADFKKQCHWCFQKQNCTLYHKVETRKTS